MDATYLKLLISVLHLDELEFGILSSRCVGGVIKYHSCDGSQIHQSQYLPRGELNVFFCNSSGTDRSTHAQYYSALTSGSHASNFCEPSCTTPLGFKLITYQH
jgi:hypothetical protein